MNGELAERERRILAMWPRFEDGEPVWIGDEAINNKNQRFTVKRIEFRHGKWMLNDSVTEGHYLNGKSGERVERPARSVLDADGVEIKVGDTVWHHSGLAHGVVTSIDAGSLMGTVRYANGGVEFRDAAKDLTHARPDSWERLESDAALSPADYIAKRGRRTDLYAYQEMPIDIVRRAKALARGGGGGMRYENLRFVVTGVCASKFREDMNGKTPTFVNVTALHNGDDALVFETPIQSAPNVGASMTMTVEWDEDE